MTDAPRYELTTDPLALRVEGEGCVVAVGATADPSLFVLSIGDHAGDIYSNGCIPTPALLAFARAVVEQFGNVEQVDDHGHPVDLPAVGSVWRARDGRLMRVDQWTRPNTYPQDDYWANLTVMNAQPRQRRTTQMKRADFGQGRFLVPDFKLSDKPLPKGAR